jgi:Domain of unknown function (DUF4406)
MSKQTDAQRMARAQMAAVNYKNWREKMSSPEGQKAYLAGPITGKQDYNIPLFDHVANKLREAGYEVFNPLDLSRQRFGQDLAEWKALSPEEEHKAYRALMAIQLHWIATNADVMFMLPGWERSFGARAENETALACKIMVREVPSVLLIHDAETKLTSMETGVGLST